MFLLTWVGDSQNLREQFPSPYFTELWSTNSKMTLQNYTYNVNPFLPIGGSPFHHATVPQVNNNLYYNVPQPSYSPDYNSPSRQQIPNYNNPRIEPYQKPGSPPSYSNPAGNSLPDPQYSSQEKGPDNYPYYQQSAPSYPAPSQPPPVPPTPSKRIPPSPPPVPTTSRPQYTRVESSSGSKTSVHAILDYDNDFEEYYDDEESPHYKYNHVTPIQGPITIRNNSVPVVPLYSYDTINNGSLLQIPVSHNSIQMFIFVQLIWCRSNFVGTFACWSSRKFGVTTFSIWSTFCHSIYIKILIRLTGLNREDWIIHLSNWS